MEGLDRFGVQRSHGCNPPPTGMLTVDRSPVVGTRPAPVPQLGPQRCRCAPTTTGCLFVVARGTFSPEN